MKTNAELELFRKLVKENSEKSFGLYGILFIKSLAEKLEKNGIISLEMHKGKIVCKVNTGEIFEDE